MKGKNELYLESIGSFIGEISRRHESDKIIRDQWDKTNEEAGTIKSGGGSKRFAKIYCDNKKLREFVNTFKAIKHAENELIYRMNYNKLCKLFNLSPNGIVIETIYTNQDDPKRNREDNERIYCKLRYTKESSKRVTIPNGSRLIHTSPEKLEEIKPTFRSKLASDQGKYFYPNSRVYFSIGSAAKGKDFGDKKSKMKHYTPKIQYTSAYIDSTYPQFSKRYVFIPTKSPIPVIDIDEENRNKKHGK